MDDNGDMLKGVTGPYDEGAYLSLLCEAEGGKSYILYRWLHLLSYFRKKKKYSVMTKM